MPTFLKSLFENKSIVSSDGAISRATGGSAGYNGVARGVGGLGSAGNWDIDVAVRSGYERVVWIFRCVDVIAQNQAKIQIQLRKGFDRRTGEIIDDERTWKLLNFRANSYETAWQFRYRLSSQLLLARRGAFIEVVKGRDGAPSELHLLPAGTTEPIPDPKTFVSGYKVTRADYRIDELDPSQVIWMRMKPHPTDPYAQMTPLVAAGLEAETDFLARLFNRNFLANDGRPGLLITIDGGVAGLSDEDAETLQRRFSGGPTLAGQTTVIEGAGMDVKDMSATPRDVQWDSLLTAGKDRLLMAFGVPESVMGNASGRTFDNADAERENFWIDTMMSHCDNIAFGFDPLSGHIDDDTVFAYNYDEVDVLQRMASARRAEWRGEVTSGLRTIDEYLEACGQKAWNVVGTRILLWNNIPIAQNPADQLIADKFVPIGAPAMPPSGGPQAITAGQPDAVAAITGAVRHMGNMAAITSRAAAIKSLADSASKKSVEQIIDAEIIEEKSHPYLGLRHRLEGAVEGIIYGWDTRQEKVVTERLMHVKSRKGTRHWDGEQHGETKALNPSYSVEIDRWTTELKQTVETVIRQAIIKEGSKAAAELKSSGVLAKLVEAGKASGEGTGMSVAYRTKAAADNAVDTQVNSVMSIVGNAARRQSERVAKTITEMDDSGASIKSIEAEVRKMIGTRSQWRKLLAVNAVTTAVEGARQSVYGQGTNYITKTWNTMGDESVRKAHKRLDHKSQPMHRPFRVGGTTLQFPGDPSADVGETIGCRCWLEYSLNPDKI